MTLDQFTCNIYLPHAKIMKRSWIVDERIARRYVSPALGKIPLDQLTAHQVANWFYALPGAGLSFNSCNRILAVLRVICGHAARLGILREKDALFKFVKSHKILIKKQRILSEEEARRLDAYLKREDCAAAYALRLLLLTGARKNEILKARWEQVDFARQTLTVPVSKSGKPRGIALSCDAVRILEELKEKGDSQWIFPGKHGGSISDIYIFWNKMRKRLGFEGMRIHDLRHSFASFLVNSGHSLYEAQILLGHANPRTTMRYASLTAETRLQAVETVSKILHDKGAMDRDVKRWRMAAAGARRMRRSAR